MVASRAGYLELADLLADAARVLDSLGELTPFCPFDSPAEFSRRVRELASRVREEDHAALRDLVPLFAPTGAWDDAIGATGMGLANRIMASLDGMGWNTE